MYVKVAPFVTYLWTAKTFETRNLVPFKGPGWYMGVSCCSLVVPEFLPDGVDPWAQTWPEDTKFVVAEYHCPFNNTVFALFQAGWAPTRNPI